MNMMPLESKAIAKVGYDGRSLRVQFPSGTFAQYKDVPREVFDGLLSAESTGRFFNDRIRYAYQIDDEVG